jgi:hypothetical protein
VRKLLVATSLRLAKPLKRDEFIGMMSALR